MAHLQITNVSKTLGDVFTLNNISIDVRPDESVVIIGPSGCGKTTLLHIIAGLIKPDQGEVIINGEKWTGRSSRVSYMQQKDLLLPSSTILDNIAIPLLLQGQKKTAARQQAALYLADFGLEGFANHYPHQLSGGMRQRAALLRTYLFTSDLMLLDEPFASLDAITRRSMILWLKDIKSRYNASLLFITHDLEEAMLLADRIYIFSARPAQVLQEIDMHSVGTCAASRQDLKETILSLLK